MNINWKVRLKNKPFLITFCTTVLTFIYTILGIFSIVPPVSQSVVIEFIAAAINILVAVGIVVDPTTTGITDSSQAMKYNTPSSN